MALNPRRSDSQVLLSPVPFGFTLLDAEKGSRWPSGSRAVTSFLWERLASILLSVPAGEELHGIPQQQQQQEDSQEGEWPGGRG